MKKPTDKKENIVHLNFSTEDHDEKVEKADRESLDQVQVGKQRRVKRKMNDLYQRWVQNLKKKARTPKEVLQATYVLQSQLGELGPAAKECGLEEWHTFTLQLIEDKLATLIATDITSANQIMQWIPEHPTMLDDDNDKIVREQLRADVKPITFRTLDELKEVPYVKQASLKEGFIGLCLVGNGLVAAYKNGDVVEIGHLVTGIAVESVPELDMFIQALAALNSPPAPTPDAGATAGPSDPS